MFVLCLCLFSGPFEIKLQTAWHLTSKIFIHTSKNKGVFLHSHKSIIMSKKVSNNFLMTSYIHSTIRLFQLYPRCILQIVFSNLLIVFQRFYQGLHIYCILVVSEIDLHCKFTVLDKIYSPPPFSDICVPLLVVFTNNTCYRYRTSRIYVVVGDGSYKLLGI